MKQVFKCHCRKIMFMPSNSDLYVHLSGCPETDEVKKYDALKWWQKIFKFNPHTLYDY